MESKGTLTGSLGGRLIVVVGSILIISIGIITFFTMRDQERQLIREVILGAERFSDTVVRSTRYDMLKVRRDDIHRIIESIGAQEGIEKVRIFNKAGEIIFSTEKSDIGARVDMEAEACYACHSVSSPIERLSTPDRTRIYHKEEDHRILGMITGIYNEPDCWVAECHAHPRETSVLGVLDIVMSLKDVDSEIIQNRNKLLLFSLLLIAIISVIIGFFIHKSVTLPIRELVTGTRKISEADLSYRLDTKYTTEIGILAESFNAMSEKLEQANRELLGWTKTLEQRVEERTAELDMTQAQLVQSEKLASLGSLAAGVAHELNNPLTGVLTYASLLHEDTPPDSPIREDLEVIINETMRCKDIIRNLLDFARRDRPSKAEVDINGVIEDTLSILKYQALFRNIEVVRRMDSSLPVVRIDAAQFEQVFMNIVMNAAEAMPGGGKLTIRTGLSEAGSSLEISFSDTGCGIKKEHLPRLFDPFFTTKEIGRGTGLGLSVSYGIVERHNGSITVESEEGEGTTFTVRIPVNPPSTPNTNDEIETDSR